MGHHVVYVEKVRPIAAGEKITIDYGHKWFNGPDHRCPSGSAFCKNPLEDEEEEMEDIDDNVEAAIGSDHGSDEITSLHKHVPADQLVV
jgi:hypothetical protein